MPLLILHIALFIPLHHCFDYLPPENYTPKDLKEGMRVKVPFGKREMIGILINTSSHSQVDSKLLKHAIAILDESSILPKKIFELIHFTSQYYHYPLGEVVACALPGLLRKGKPLQFTQSPLICHEEQITYHELDSHQKEAVDSISQHFSQFQTFLLHGVTGSGKTEVYLQVIEKVLYANQQALVLVPEISLTPQTIARFQERFGIFIAVLHSGLTEKQRLDAWVKAKEGVARIVIGTRSAIFTPLKNPGIIIVDEEHDVSFKQQTGLHYCARDLAIVRAQIEKIPVVLGSATPSLESFYNAKNNRYRLLELPQRVGNAVKPNLYLIDLRNQPMENNLSFPLLEKIREHLENKGQILLFLNRRGFAPVLICYACGWVANCKRCDAKLTLHRYPFSLQCHHCNSSRIPDQHCPECKSENLFQLGYGTQRLEETLKKHFPEVGIIRIDRDSTRKKGDLQNILETIHNGENRILIGTQMLAKGHHFPEVTLAAILNADSGLFSTDFRASERMAQLLIQVAGRAGRSEKTGEVFIQTHHPDHPLIQRLIQQNYADIASVLLTERSEAALPPHAHLALIRAESTYKEQPLIFLKQVRDLSHQLSKNKINIWGPIPSVMEKKAGHFRAQLLFQTTKRHTLHSLLKNLLTQIESLPNVRRVRWSLDVDPREMV